MLGSLSSSQRATREVSLPALFCVERLTSRALETNYPQHSVSFSTKKGTLRGMHYQSDPHSEVKLVRCVKGAIWDVIIDIRPTSQTFCGWKGFELSGENGRQLYIPKGFAHGFQTLSDDVEVSYLISERYSPQAARGIRYDDPRFAINWPLPVTQIADKDEALAHFREVKTPTTVVALTSIPSDLKGCQSSLINCGAMGRGSALSTPHFAIGRAA